MGSWACVLSVIFLRVRVNIATFVVVAKAFYVWRSLLSLDEILICQPINSRQALIWFQVIISWFCTIGATSLLIRYLMKLWNPINTFDIANRKSVIILAIESLGTKHWSCQSTARSSVDISGIGLRAMLRLNNIWKVFHFVELVLFHTRFRLEVSIVHASLHLVLHV